MLKPCTFHLWTPLVFNKEAFPSNEKRPLLSNLIEFVDKYFCFGQDRWEFTEKTSQGIWRHQITRAPQPSLLNRIVKIASYLLIITVAIALILKLLLRGCLLYKYPPLSQRHAEYLVSLPQFSRQEEQTILEEHRRVRISKQGRGTIIQGREPEEKNNLIFTHPGFPNIIFKSIPNLGPHSGYSMAKRRCYASVKSIETCFNHNLSLLQVPRVRLINTNLYSEDNQYSWGLVAEERIQLQNEGDEEDQEDVIRKAGPLLKDAFKDLLKFVRATHWTDLGARNFPITKDRGPQNQLKLALVDVEDLGIITPRKPGVPSRIDPNMDKNICKTFDAITAPLSLG